MRRPVGMRWADVHDTVSHAALQMHAMCLKLLMKAPMLLLLHFRSSQRQPDYLQNITIEVSG